VNEPEKVKIDGSSINSLVIGGVPMHSHTPEEWVAMAKVAEVVLRANGKWDQRDKVYERLLRLLERLEDR
jgi:hypothetical protein